MSPAVKNSNKSGKKAHASGKGKARQAATKSKVVAEQVPVGEASEGEGMEVRSEDEEDVDEEGLQRLMDALGEDGLGDFERAQLHALGGLSEAEDEEGSGSEEEELDAEEEEEEEEEEEKEEELALDEVDSVDEDAVPRQKIEIDNKVSTPECPSIRDHD
jgi:rRNA-processing protein EBP2